MGTLYTKHVVYDSEHFSNCDNNTQPSHRTDRFNNQGQQSTSQFVPKILVGFNTQNILVGQASYDNFFQDCLLENHLHRFGILGINQNSDPVRDEEQSEETSFSPLWPELQSSSQSQHFDFRSCLSQNSCSECGSSIYSEDQNLQPPPYSELADDPPVPEDPPPPYSKTLERESLRDQESQF